ncbi:zinc protease [Desulfonatronum thiosulfatophilum]|uniref:Zinc protease n=1 Tax=Desulfonatronum thiosulfatophilum TaxID=617002 RepID=A0A1G6E2C9_9BACT|nr:pitrilysin family protein [Desulfonatronum thiosulfatophilum]SDB51510.1 zinc protease [Desulfonatronum thiosulfatophilum]
MYQRNPSTQAVPVPLPLRGHFLILFLFFFTAAGLFAAPATAAEFEHWETEKGMNVLFAPAPALPMLDVRLLFDAGSSRDGDRGGLARMTNQALAFGTAELDADGVAERFESVGAQFGASAARDMAVLRLRTLTEPDWMETALSTFVSLLADPAFPEDDLARARRQTLQALRQERQEPGTLASRRFYQLAYGDHPYAAHPLGTENSIPNLDRDELLRFFQEHYTSRNGVLTMTGDLDLDTARQISERICAALPQGEWMPELPPITPLTAPVLEHIPFASEQAHIHMGTPLLRRDDPDRFPLSLANHVLGGGGFTSRLFREIRNERGLAYSVSSSIVPMSVEGPFVISMQTGIDQAPLSVEVLHSELRQFIEHGVTEEELAASKANIIGRFPLSLVSNSEIVSTLAMIGFYNLPLDYLETYTEHVSQVTTKESRDALQRRLRPEAMVTVIVGGPEGLFGPDGLAARNPSPE